jgi:hypothetical protein
MRPSVDPDTEVMACVLECIPVTRGQLQVFQALYKAGNRTLSLAELSQEIGRPEQEISGIFRALGLRVNGTRGVEGKPGKALLIDRQDNRYSLTQKFRKLLETEFPELLTRLPSPFGKDWLPGYRISRTANY